MARTVDRKRSISIDATDLRILELLQTSSKVTNAALAEHIGISPPSTLERVRKLEQQGIIRGYVALLDPEQVNKRITAIVEVSLAEHSHDNLTRAKQAIGEFPEVLACWHTAGDQDFVLHVLVQDMREYEEFVTEKLSTAARIGRIRTSIVVRTVKQTTQIPLDALSGPARDA